MASNRDGIATEEALILRGYFSHLRECRRWSNPSSPQPGQLEAYREALERLNASIAFKSSEEDTSQAVSLNLSAILVGPNNFAIRLA